MYEIHSKSDFQAGVTLSVRIPEVELDKKALYTLLAEQTEFVLPFRHRMIDGQIELTYQVGTRSKLAYVSGTRSPGEYADLWQSIIQPLVDCRDWFLNPYSFVLNPEYLYFDKKNKMASFVYIPSVRACSDDQALKNMVTEVAKQNPVTDMELENKVIWAIHDFNPSNFLLTVKQFKDKPIVSAPLEPVAASPAQRNIPQAEPVKIQQSAPVMPKTNALGLSAVKQQQSDDIAIHFPPDKSFGSAKSKQLKPPPEPKPKAGLFGRKKPPQREIIQGAASTQVLSEPVRELASAHSYAAPAPADDDVTQLDLHETGNPTLRYVGGGEHPKVIEITVAAGKVFTIGRFDASVGARQSMFEFDKKTKAVSRRHAAIEHNENGYYIVDLGSSAGTFMNGQKLPPSAPFKLERGCRVSFGHSGADYIWEE